MAAEPTREWSDEQLKSDDLPKKDLIKFIQDNAAHSVCLAHWCVCGCGLDICMFKVFKWTLGAAACCVVSLMRKAVVF